MMHFKPRKLIDKSNLNNIDQYSIQIKEYPLVEEYMWHIFKKWIEDLPNPLEIPWIYQLYENRISYLEKFLQQMEDQIGEENLKICLKELLDENGKVEDLYRKIESISAELMTFSQLKELGHTNLRKILTIGDIESDTSIVSIKSILDLEINYRIIENKIWGLSIISENEVLRKIDFVRLFNQENIDYRFLKNITNFLEESLINSLEFLTNENKSNLLNIEFQKPIINKTNQIEGLFKVSINRWYQNSTEKNCFCFDESRKGEKKKHKIEMQFERDLIQESDFFYVTNDTTMWGEGEEICSQFLTERIEIYLHEIDKHIDEVPKEKCFIGWINISISPKYQNSVIRNIEKIENVIKELKGNRRYQIVLCLTPQLGLDMKVPKLIIL